MELFSFLFKVKRNDKLGRYMVATRNLKPGEVLFREFPVVHGPKMLSHPICLGCHKALTPKSPKGNFYRCSRCSWPLCSKQCENLEPHVEECKLMTTAGYKCPFKTNCSTMQYESIYCLIFPLRFLLLKRCQPNMWEIYTTLWISSEIFPSALGFNFRFEKILSELESHVDERIASGSYDALQKHLVPFVQKLLGSKEFPTRLILKAAAILDNNCFEISMPLRGVEMGGLFLTSLILCHDCVPNTKHYVNYLGSDVDIQCYQMTFQTTGGSAKLRRNRLCNSCFLLSFSVPVKKGEQLTTTYTNTLKSTLERRRHLSQTKIFDCDCMRCRDASEFSSYGSSWMCDQCGGLIVSKNPLDNSSSWECRKCKSQKSQEVGRGTKSLGGMTS